MLVLEEHKPSFRECKASLTDELNQLDSLTQDLVALLRPIHGALTQNCPIKETLGMT